MRAFQQTAKAVPTPKNKSVGMVDAVIKGTNHQHLGMSIGISLALFFQSYELK
jgi:hypothetical protein